MKMLNSDEVGIVARERVSLSSTATSELVPSQCDFMKLFLRDYSHNINAIAPLSLRNVPNQQLPLVEWQDRRGHLGSVLICSAA